MPCCFHIFNTFPQRLEPIAKWASDDHFSNYFSNYFSELQTGYKEGDFFNNALGGGFDKNESAAIGAFSGLASGLTSALGSTNTVNNAGQETVDRCIRTRGYVVY